MGRSVYSVDLTKVRGWSAVRRGVLVPVTMIVAGLLTDPEVGALAGMSALFVGLQERNASASYTSRVMIVQSFFFAAVVFVGGAMAHLWATPVLLGLTAVAAGFAAYHDKAMSRMFGDVMPVAAFLGLSTVSTRAAAVMAAAVLFGGLAQALLARLSVRLEEDIMERRPVAAALVAVADHLDDALPRRSSLTGQLSEERITAAAATLAASDLAEERRRSLQSLLGDAEVLRQEAAAIRVRRALGLSVGAEDQVGDAIAIASQALRSLAVAMSSVRIPGRYDHTAEAAFADLYRCRLGAEGVLEDGGADPTARAVAGRILLLNRNVSSLMANRAERATDRARRVGEGMSQYLLRPNRRDRVVGLRLGAATLVAFVVAYVLDLPYGAWVASTTVALLRPDWRALTADTVARALGTAGAAALALPLVWAAGSRSWLDIWLILVLSVAAYVIATVNEGLYVMATALVVVFSRAVLGESPVDAAAARVIDVVVGCVIAIAFLTLIPVSHGRRLTRDLAAYCTATADWLQAVGVLAAGRNPPGEQLLRQSMRAARVRVQHGIELRTIEPFGPGMPARRAQQLFTLVHDCARAAAAAERTLKHGGTTGPASRVLAQDAAQTLRQLAIALSGHRMVSAPARPPHLNAAAWDDGAILMRHANDLAHMALESLVEHDAHDPA